MVPGPILKQSCLGQVQPSLSRVSLQAAAGPRTCLQEGLLPSLACWTLQALTRSSLGAERAQMALAQASKGNSSAA